jgi:hypothetical protein
VLRTGLHGTASKSSPRKAQQQPNDNFLQEHMNVSNLFEINETQVKVTIVYPSGNVAIPKVQDKQSQMLIKNISLKNWKAAANGFFAHKSLKEELPAALYDALYHPSLSSTVDQTPF